MTLPKATILITRNDLVENTPLMGQLHNYFSKIKIRLSADGTPPNLSLSVVKNICEKHRQHFAYSTLRTNFGMRTIFTFEALLSDLLTDSAGHCVHHNATVYLALVYIGFAVNLIKANFADKNNASIPLEIVGHAAIVLTLEGQQYLVDPGLYGNFTELELPTDNLISTENFKKFRLIKNPIDKSNYILQKKKKESWVNIHFFSTAPIKFSEINALSTYLLSKDHPNYNELILSMFHKKKHIVLSNRDIFFTRAPDSAYVYIEQPTIHYALTTLESANEEFKEVSRKAGTLLAQFSLINENLAHEIRLENISSQVKADYLR